MPLPIREPEGNIYYNIREHSKHDMQELYDKAAFLFLYKGNKYSYMSKYIVDEIPIPLSQIFSPTYMDMCTDYRNSMCTYILYAHTHK